MEKIRNNLTAIVLGGALAFSIGCDNNIFNPKKPEYITGTVLKESGTIIDRQKVIEHSEGALFGNDSVRFSDPTYTIQFKTDDGKVYTFAVNETYQKKLGALSLAIEEGTKIRILKQFFNWHLKGTVGKINDYELEVLAKE